MHASHTCTLCVYLLSWQIENAFLTFPVGLHIHVEQTIWHLHQSGASLKSYSSKDQGVHGFLGTLREAHITELKGGSEESACCLQETVLVMAVWKERRMEQAGQ